MIRVMISQDFVAKSAAFPFPAGATLDVVFAEGGQKTRLDRAGSILHQTFHCAKD